MPMEVTRSRTSSCKWSKVLLLWACFICPTVLSTYVPFMEQGFFFDYNQPIPIPVTRQCDSLNISWSRSQATGPNPTAPYYLQVYTSTFIVPFVIPAGSGLNYNWQVPFAPGTQYQICMFDSNGVTGGCQAIYTVIPSNSSNSTATPTCTNVTFPAGALDVVGTVHNGPMSQYGWIDQCTDLSVLPKNGTPPYIFTIATTLHPPTNITSKTMDAMNWTVSLSWASPFFVSVVDSQGNSWANGPLHSGGGGPTDCLSLGAGATGKVSHGATVGAGIGGAIAGSLLGIIASFLYLRKRKRKSSYGRFAGSDKPSTDQNGDEAELVEHTAVPASSLERAPSGRSREATIASGISSSGASPSLLSRLGQTNQQFHVEPFVLSGPATQQPRCLPSEATPASPASPSSIEQPNTSDAASASTAQPDPPPAPVPQAQTQASQVYVVHHDGGRAPVTVYTPDGTEVVELPPRYADSQEPPRQTRRLPTTAASKLSQPEASSSS